MLEMDVNADMYLVTRGRGSKINTLVNLMVFGGPCREGSPFDGPHIDAVVFLHV